MNVGENLSIVVQGPLWEENIVRVASYCDHWRSLFPDAEIILSISISDLLSEGCPGRGPTWKEWAREKALVNQAIRRLGEVTDLMILAPPSVPLPPIKSDSPGPNHGNMQLAAAYAGLQAATRPMTLRIRNDMIFLDSFFLDHHRSLCRLRRPEQHIFNSRILVSPLFTLNPYALERLPYHISDWFHYGETKDLQRLWDCPPMTLADAIYYSARPHLPHSNDKERKFLTRFAVEQHLILSVLKRSGRDPGMFWHNEIEYADASIELLKADFAIADLTRCSFVFDKYAHLLKDEEMNKVCISHSEWVHLLTRERDDKAPSETKTTSLEEAQLRSGDILRAGESLVTPRGTWRLRFEIDGSGLVREPLDGGDLGKAWRIGFDQPAAFLAMQEDGNLVAYSEKNAPLWSSESVGFPGSVLTLAPDGELSVSIDGTVVWTMQ